MKILLTFFLFLSLLTGFGQSGTPAKRLLERAWKAHVPRGTLKTLVFTLDGKKVQSEMKTDTVGLLRSMGVPADSLASALREIKAGPTLGIPPSLRSKPQEYFALDVAGQRLATIRLFAGSQRVDSLRWVIRDGTIRAYHTPAPVAVALADWFSYGIASPTMLVRMLRTTDSLGYLGIVPFRGETYEGLEVRSRKQTYQFYFDQKSALLRHVVVHAIGTDRLPLGSQSQFRTFTYEGYRQSSGLLLPNAYTEEWAFDPYTLIRTTTPYGPPQVDGLLEERFFTF